MKVGTRAAMMTGGSIYGSAWVITGIGVATHNLPLVYLGNRESKLFFDAKRNADSAVLLKALLKPFVFL
jgi:hypothetical protein